MAPKTFSISTSTVNVRIEGVNPLLIHRFREENERPDAIRPAKSKRVNDTQEEALLNANRTQKGYHYISAFAVINSMVATGQNHKQRGNRKNLGYLVPSACRVAGDNPDIILINVVDHVATDKDVIVDARPVVIPATKGRIMRYRPKYENWYLEFSLTILTDLIDVDTAYRLLCEAGLQIGLGDFRPQKRGPFGTFMVTEWKEVSSTKGNWGAAAKKEEKKEPLAAKKAAKGSRGTNGASKRGRPSVEAN